MKDFRKKIINELRTLFESDRTIYSVWEGGSAASGFLDEYSDLDIGLICADDVVENIFTKLEEFLATNYGIKHKFRMPEPCWHGHSQCFYLLERTVPYFYIDILIEKESSGNRFTESDRHGNSVIWFDRKELIDPTPTPEDEILGRGSRMFKIIKGYVPFQIMDLKKQIQRGNEIDAYDLYNKLLNRFGALLNLKFRPHKYDFGIRYMDRDYPDEITEMFKSLLAPGKIIDLKECTEILEIKIYELLNELDEKWGK